MFTFNDFFLIKLKLIALLALNEKENAVKEGNAKYVFFGIFVTEIVKIKFRKKCKFSL